MSVFYLYLIIHTVTALLRLAAVMSSDSDGEPRVAIAPGSRETDPSVSSARIPSANPVSTYIIVYVIFVVNFVLYIKLSFLVIICLFMLP